MFLCKKALVLLIFVICIAVMWPYQGFSLHNSSHFLGGWKTYFPVSAQINRVLVHPWNSNIVFAATQNVDSQGGLYKSTDGGRHWYKIGNFTAVKDIAIDNCYPNVIYAASGSSIMKSTDGGNTWRLTYYFSGDEVTSIAAHCDNIIAGVSGFWDDSLYRSSDGGLNWHRKFKVRAIGYWHRITIDPHNPSIVWAGHRGVGIYKSTNFGDVWTESNGDLPSCGTGRWALDMVIQGNTIWLAADICDYHGVYRSTNGGLSWTPLYGGFSTTVSSLTRDDTGTLYIGTDNAGGSKIPTGVYRSRDGGYSWTPMNEGLGEYNVQDLEYGGGRLFAGTASGVWMYEGIFTPTPTPTRTPTPRPTPTPTYTPTWTPTFTPLPTPTRTFTPTPTPVLSKAQVHGLIWEDRNRNYSRDVGEPPLLGVVVSLLLSNTRVTQYVSITDATGHYRFSDVRPDSYILKVYPPVGYIPVSTDEYPLGTLSAGADIEVNIALYNPQESPVNSLYMPAVWKDSTIR